MQHSRRHDPYPFTWEIPLAVGIAVVLVLVLGAHAGRAVAALLAGVGWIWSPHAALFTALPGLLAGDATVGLAPPDSAHASAVTPGLLWACIGAVELALLLVMGAAGKAGMGRWGPGRVHGVASRAEAEQLLGRARLRQHRGIIRPDLYGNHGHRSRDRT